MFFFLKYTDDKKKDKVPYLFPAGLNIDDLINKETIVEPEDTLLISYRTVCDDDFFYFVTRILAAVNASNTTFDSKKTSILLSDIFSVSDEAYALITLLNECHVWEEQAKDKSERDESKMKRKFVNATSGKKNSWTKEGMKIFHILCNKIAALRNDSVRGKGFEEMLRTKFQDEMVNSGKKSSSVEKENDDSDNEMYYMDDSLKNMLEL